MIPAINEVLINTSSLLTLVLALWAIFKWKVASKEQPYLCWLVWVSAATEILAYVLIWLFSFNLPLLHVFTVIEFYLIVKIYQTALKEKNKDQFFKVSVIGFTIIAIVYASLSGNIMKMNDVVRVVESIYLTFLALYFFYHTLQTLEIRHLEHSSMFWINAAVLIYFSSNLFIFLLSNYGDFFEEGSDLADIMYGLHATITITKHLLFAIALGVNNRNG